MRHHLATLLVFGVIGGGVVAMACGGSDGSALSSGGARGSSGGLDDAGGVDPLAVDDGGGVNDGINTTGVGAGTGANTGLPCDVQQLLENRCIGCHLGPSPAALLTYTDLLKPSSDPTKNLAQKSLERMQSTTSPMPPKPAVAPTAAEIQTMQAWVTAGTPKGTTCTPPADGGVDAGSGGNIYNTPLQCSTNTTWTGGNRESPNMRPGGACITCHTMRGGPAFTIAGTIYKTAHEPNDCNGSAGTGLTVVVTDANNKVVNVPVNSVGNFYSSAAIAAPFHVKVTNGAKERVMAGALTAGDCNSCHTPTGANGAPGRIMAP